MPGMGRLHVASKGWVGVFILKLKYVFDFTSFFAAHVVASGKNCSIEEVSVGRSWPGGCRRSRPGGCLTMKNTAGTGRLLFL